MNTSHGWIKLYRCLLEDPIWQCSTSEQKVILVTLLLMANHAEKKWQWQGKPYVCKPGQMVTSLKSISHKAGPGISRKRVHLALRKFENCGFLVKQPTRNNTLITICNWERYQTNPYADGTPEYTPATHDGNTDGAQRSLNKKIRSKNEKTLSLREDNSLNDLNNDNDPLLQETLRIAQEYDNEQKRICEMFQRTNP